MDRQVLLRGLRRLLGKETNVKGDEAVFWCPRHGHRPSRVEGELSVNLRTEKFHCWHCDFGGSNLLPLLARKTAERDVYKAELDARNGIARKDVVRTYDEVVLPAEFRSLSRPVLTPYGRMAKEYLAERGVTPELTLLYKLGYCEDGEYRDRIILPSFDEHGALNYFVGRTFRGDPFRYKNGNFDKDIISNDCLVDWTRPIVIVEGLFDAMKAGTQAVALQGSRIYEDSQLFEKVVRTGVDVYFALDADMVRKQLDIVKRFVEFGVRSYIVDLAGRKDVGEMGPGEFEQRQARAVVVRSELDLMRIRVAQA